MKKYIKNIIFGVLSLVLVFVSAQNVKAESIWNNAPSGDCPDINIANVATSEGYSSPCWHGTSINAKPGEIINVKVYYHNTSSSNATNTRVKITAPSGSYSSHSFSGQISATEGNLYTSSVNANLPSSQSLTFLSARWFANQSSSSYQEFSGNSALSSGVSIGTVAPGFDNQGSVVFRFKVNETAPVEYCNDPNALNNGGISPCQYPQQTELCSINNFTATRSTITRGDKTTLDWSTTGCRNITLSSSSDKYVMPSGSQSQWPTVTTNYILSGESTSGVKETKTIKVTVNEPQVQTPSCKINDLFASSATINSGSSSTLSWTTSNCNSVTLSSVSGNVDISGQYTVRPAITTTYTLSARGVVGSDSKLVKVTVNELQPKVMSGYLTASPTSCIIPKGSSSCSVSLKWDTTNPAGTSLVTLPDRTVLYTGNSGTKPVSISNGYKTYYLENNGSNLDEERVSASCAIGSTWSGTYCAPSDVPTPLACSIKDFGSNPTTINKGSSANLYWETRNCTSVNISGVSDVVNGSKTVNPQITTTYTLNASNATTKDTTSIKITVNQPDPEVMRGSISASPSNCTIPKNGSTCETILSWNTVNPKGTSTVTKPVNQTVATGNNGPKTVTISHGTTSFYLYNSNVELATTSASASCASGSQWVGTYCAPSDNNQTNNCSLTSFTVNGKTTDTVDYREKTTLAWTSNYCNSVSITPYVNNNLNVNDSEYIYPTNTTTYVITAFGNNSSQDSRTVKVNVNDDDDDNEEYCSIETFRADDRQIEFGDETNIEWETEGCESVSITNLNKVSRSGNRDVSPLRPTTYKITAYDEDGDKETRSLYVDVVPRGSIQSNDYCVINNFSASQNYVNPGASVVLNWDTYDCSSVNITYLGPVSNSGYRTVNPNTTTNYLLTAYGRRGEKIDRSVSVVVNNNIVNPPIIIPISNSCAVTTVATNITGSSATLNGFISDSGSGNGYFEYGSTTSPGSRTQSRFVSNGASFSENISGLSSNGIYYYRFVTDCNGGNGYGAIDVFRTLGSSVVRPVIYQGTTVVGSASPIMLKIENRYEAIGERDTIEYTVTYKNIGKSTLRNPILQVIVPEGITIRNASRGTYQEDTRTLTVELDDLVPGEEGVIYVQGYVVSIQDSMAKIVTTALLVYTNTNDSQENAIAYVLNIPKQFFSNGNVLGASAFFSNLFGGDCNLGLIGWLLLLILILLIILIIRRYFYTPRQNHVNPVYPSNYPPNYPPNQTH